MRFGIRCIVGETGLYMERLEGGPRFVGRHEGNTERIWGRGSSNNGNQSERWKTDQLASIRKVETKAGVSKWQVGIGEESGKGRERREGDRGRRDPYLIGTANDPRVIIIKIIKQ